MMFEVTSDDKAKIDKWLKEEVYPPIIAEQRESHHQSNPVAEYEWGAGYPYEGAIGGGVTYEFTPTSIGTVFKVRAYDQVLDLTDYGSW